MSKKMYRAQVTLSADDVALVQEIADGIGCAREAVVSYMLDQSIEQLRAIPKRSRVADLKRTRLTLKGTDDFLQQTVRRARGVSAGYIFTAMHCLFTLARERYDSYR